MRNKSIHSISRRATIVATVFALPLLIASPAWALDGPNGPVTDPIGPPHTQPQQPATGSSTPSSGSSTSTSSTPTSKTKTSAGVLAQQATRLKVLQARADAEIERRIKALDGLTTLITNSKKLNSADKASLNAEISGEINGDSTFTGLDNLKAKIDADTSLSVALQDAKSIVTEYRVFVFIMPQVHIVGTADQQQTIESKLSDFAAKLQTRITDAQNQGKNVSTLQTEYDNMIQAISKASNLSETTEDAVIALHPADYDGDTAILKQYRQDLQTAHQDNQTALTDAKQIVQSLGQL